MGAADAERVRQVPVPAIVAVLVLAVVCFSPAVLGDGDTFTHIAAGGWMLDHRAALDRDPFTATFMGQPWSAHEWLAEIMLAVAFRLGGPTGVVLLTGAAAAAAFASLARHVGASAGPRATMILVAGALMCTLPVLLARPHLLALPALEVWVAALMTARRVGRAPTWWLLGVMVAWANLHGGFAFGLAIAVALAVEASVVGGAPRAIVRSWWSFVAAATLVALATPQGWDGLIFPLRLVRMTSLALVSEWQPVVFGRDLSIEAVILGVVALLATGRVRLPWFRVMLLLVLMHLALAHVRHGVLFGVTGALLLAEPVGRAFAERRAVSERVRGGWRASAGPGRGLADAALALVLAARVATPAGLESGPAVPRAALAGLPASMTTRPVLNSVRFGGYLALAGVRPFIDGRAELFGDAFIGDYVAMSRSDGRSLREGLDRYGIDWAILSVDDPLTARFDEQVGWRRFYADQTAIVFVPTSSKTMTATDARPDEDRSRSRDGDAAEGGGSRVSRASGGSVEGDALGL